MRSEFLCLEVQVVSVANSREGAELCRCGSSAACVEEEDVCVVEAELESGRPHADSLGKHMNDPATAFPPLNKGIFA